MQLSLMLIFIISVIVLSPSCNFDELVKTLEKKVKKYELVKKSLCAIQLQSMKPFVLKTIYIDQNLFPANIV